MARELYRLTAVSVRKLAEPGRYSDGGGLYVLILPSGSKSWVFRWRDRVSGKLRDKGLGPTWDVSLEQARQRAKECRDAVRIGGDPIGDVKAALAAKRMEAAKQLTFEECAKRYIESHRAGWRNAKHAAQWTATLATYAKPINSLPVAAVDKTLVLRCLEPIWRTKVETATRVRQRIECVLDWATASDFRSGENPARWRGHLSKLLPEPAALRKVKNRPSLPYEEIAAFVKELRKREGLSARALELQILTAARPGEVVAARRSEFDLSKKLWIVPAERMKANREHRVPLSDPAVALLRDLDGKGEFVFPGKTPETSITIAAPLELLKDMRPNVVPHGFRATFRTWAAESTNYPHEVAEAALAHVVRNKTENAYNRRDLFDKRALLMRDWATFVATPMRTGNVTPIKRKAKA
jgi:integrase